MVYWQKGKLPQLDGSYLFTILSFEFWMIFFQEWAPNMATAHILTLGSNCVWIFFLFRISLSWICLFEAQRETKSFKLKTSETFPSQYLLCEIKKRLLIFLGISNNTALTYLHDYLYYAIHYYSDNTAISNVCTFLTIIIATIYISTIRIDLTHSTLS